MTEHEKDPCAYALREIVEAWEDEDVSLMWFKNMRGAIAQARAALAARAATKKHETPCQPSKTAWLELLSRCFAAGWRMDCYRPSPGHGPGTNSLRGGITTMWYGNITDAPEEVYRAVEAALGETK